MSLKIFSGMFSKDSNILANDIKAESKAAAAVSNALGIIQIRDTKEF
jgi:hypothetical protein